MRSRFFTSLAMASAILASHSPSFAQTYPTGAEQSPQVRARALQLEAGFLYDLLVAHRRLLAGQTDGCLNCSLLPEESMDSRGQCREFYRDLYSRGRIDIRVGFGYMDYSEGEDHVYLGYNFGRNFAIDTLARNSFVKTLTEKCRGQEEVCGFRVDPHDPDLLTKPVLDADGRTVEARIRVTSSSYTENTRWNESQYSLEQDALSRKAEQNFFGGVDEADVLIYIGHSRNGGGPDFRPPILLPDYKVNYAPYKKNRPGLNRLVKALNSARRKPGVVAILSCLSETHFHRSLQRAHPRGAFLLTTGDSKEELANYHEVLQNAFGTVDSVLRKKCAAGIRRAVHFTPSTARGYTLKNFK